MITTSMFHLNSAMFPTQSEFEQAIAVMSALQANSFIPDNLTLGMMNRLLESPATLRTISYSVSEIEELKRAVKYRAQDRIALLNGKADITRRLLRQSTKIQGSDDLSFQYTTLSSLEGHGLYEGNVDVSDTIIASQPWCLVLENGSVRAALGKDVMAMLEKTYLASLEHEQCDNVTLYLHPDGGAMLTRTDTLAYYRLAVQSLLVGHGDISLFTQRKELGYV